MRSTKGKDPVKARVHISAQRLRDVAEERSILSRYELEHLGRCDLCVDYFVDHVRFSVEKKLKVG